jgi:uncharacterized membrane protein
LDEVQGLEKSEENNRKGDNIVICIFLLPLVLIAILIVKAVYDGSLILFFTFLILFMLWITVPFIDDEIENKERYG